MNKMQIDNWVRNKQVRLRQLDVPRIKSMIEFSQTNAKVAKKVPLNDESATLIFREIYESIRQLGDAKLWLEGFEPLSHEVSMEMLKEIDIKNKVALNHLMRFKRIRNDANYRGNKVALSQAKEIIEFWEKCSLEIIDLLLNELKDKR